MHRRRGRGTPRRVEPPDGMARIPSARSRARGGHAKDSSFMTEISHIAQMPGRARDARIIGLVSGAHFISHLYMLVLPPVFAFIKADYAVSYAELGFAIATFNVVSAAFQTPAGFLVDRFGAPRLLIAGLALSAFSAALAGLLPSYGGLIAAFALLGLANTIYHPADYAILSHTIDHRGLGKAFSLHTFFGTLGTAVAPTLMLFLTGIWGWRGATAVPR